jgi:micrococcal nuclease
MYEYKCTILRVVDGDTADVDIDLGFGVWLRRQRVRFHGIDTPESRTSDKEEKKYGLAAKQFVKDHMPVGSTQILVTQKDDAVGKYGRILGRFKLEDGRILNDMMIEEHHAVAYFGQSKDDIAEGHIKNREFIDVSGFTIK